MAAKNSTRNPLIGDSTVDTAANISCVVSFLTVADASMGLTVEMNNALISGRARILDCVQSAAESLAHVEKPVKRRARKKRAAANPVAPAGTEGANHDNA